MVILSSLSLRSRGDGHPFMSIPPLPLILLPLSSSEGSLLSLSVWRSWGRSAPSVCLRFLSTYPRLPSAVPWLSSVSLQLRSALPASGERDPSSPQLSRSPLPSQRMSETGAAKTACPHPRFEVLPGIDAAAGAPLGRGRPGGTSPLVAPARECTLSSPEPEWLCRRTGSILPEGVGPGLPRGRLPRRQLETAPPVFSSAAAPPPLPCRLPSGKLPRLLVP